MKLIRLCLCIIISVFLVSCAKHKSPAAITGIEVFGDRVTGIVMNYASNPSDTYSFIYDSQSRLQSFSGNSGDQTSYTYSAAGKMIHVDTSFGSSTNAYYSPDGKKIRTEDYYQYSSYASDFTYDASGRKASQINYSMNMSTGLYEITVTYTYQYDAGGRLIRKDETDTYGSGSDYYNIYTYNSSGKLSEKQEYSTASGALNRVVYTYSADGRIKQFDFYNSAGSWQGDMVFTYGAGSGNFFEIFDSIME